MLNESLLEKIFADKHIQKLPVAEQTSVADVIERILEEIKEENPYVSISELFNADE